MTFQDAPNLVQQRVASWYPLKKRLTLELIYYPASVSRCPLLLYVRRFEFSCPVVHLLFGAAPVHSMYTTVCCLCVCVVLTIYHLTPLFTSTCSDQKQHEPKNLNRFTSSRSPILEATHAFAFTVVGDLISSSDLVGGSPSLSTHATSVLKSVFVNNR